MLLHRRFNKFRSILADVHVCHMSSYKIRLKKMENSLKIVWPVHKAGVDVVMGGKGFFLI